MAAHAIRTKVWRALAAALIVGLSGCGGAAVGDGTEPRVIEISIDGFHFVPDHFTVQRGDSVRFLISNPDRVGHELFIGTIAEQAMRREAAPSTPSDGGSVTHFGYGIYVPALTDGELDYAFSNDTDLLIGCHLPGHWEEGMVATIDVQP
jgi:uncharacterized cupredoxin-like copper-binding protein